MKLRLAALPITLMACSAFVSRAESPCFTAEQLTPSYLPDVAASRSKSAHVTLQFPGDSDCLLDQVANRQVVLVALAKPPLQVTVSTVARGEKGLMPVRVTVLDAHRQPIRTFLFDSFTQRGMRRSLSFHLHEDVRPRYLLIEADDEHLGRSGSLVAGVRSTVMWVAAGYMGTLTNGSERTIPMPFVEAGEVDIEFERVDAEWPSR